MKIKPLIRGGTESEICPACFCRNKKPAGGQCRLPVGKEVCNYLGMSLIGMIYTAMLASMYALAEALPKACFESIAKEPNTAFF